MHTLFYFLFILGIFIINSQAAQAYLDPGSGSLLFQVVIGGILSGLFAIKLYYKKIKIFFKKISTKNTGKNVEQEKNK